MKETKTKWEQAHLYTEYRSQQVRKKKVSKQDHYIHGMQEIQNKTPNCITDTGQVNVMLRNWNLIQEDVTTVYISPQISPAISS